MKVNFKHHLTRLTIFCLTLLVFSCQKEEKVFSSDFNFDWKFHKGDIAEAINPDFNDSDWRDVRLPHDWSVEESFTQKEAAGATAFLPGGIGWYRKNFKMPASASDKITRINFDGVYNNSEVWINGQSLGKRPYGYIGFYYDLTPYLKYGDEINSIAVRADRSAYVDCRWYPGSGIYRNVKLETLNKLHIKEWGTFITTPEVSQDRAKVAVMNTVVNRNDVSKKAVVKTVIFNKEGASVASESSEVVLAAGESKDLEQILEVVHPKLWNTEIPNLYEAKISIIEDSTPLDEYATTFGIREIRYDAEKGFFLNGTKTVFKGVCLHHDGGLVGAAVPKGVWERRLKKLKEAGCNAIRTAHNPPSEEFLELCDEMGFLVQDEAFDEWDNPKDKRNNYNQEKAEEVTRGYTEHIHEWAEKDIKSMVLRDRNHPSIVMWSIGNEIEWTYPSYQSAAGYWEEIEDVDYYYDEPPYSPKEIKQKFKEAEPDNYELAAMAQNLSKWVKEIDVSRPVTANLVIPSVSYFSGYTDALDVVGLSYRQSVYDYIPKLYPDKMVLGTENWAQWHEWKAVDENENIHGIFLWTGIFYMGESRKWPVKGSGSGLLDFAAYERPSYHLFKTLWNDTPHVYMNTIALAESSYELVNGKVLSKRRNEKYIPMWGWQPYNEHWNYQEGEATVVEIFTNCKEVELFLNEKSLGKQMLADNNEDRIIKWQLPFSAGKLVARGTRDDGSSIDYILKTADQMGGISIQSDKQTLQADGYDVAHITVELVDENGIPFRTDDQEVEFEIDGDYRLLGVDNGANDNVQDIQTNRIITKNGRCLLIIQSNRTSGLIGIKAKSGLFSSETITINVGI